MIIFKDPPLAIITPPKNASTSLHMFLCSPEIGGIHAIGPMPMPEPVDIERHTVFIHRDWLAECRPVFVVRNPYERAVSLWKHGIKYGNYQKDYTGNFIGFVRDWLKPNASHWWQWPQIEYLRHCNSDLAAYFISTERLKFGLGNLGIDLKGRNVPFENVSEGIRSLPNESSRDYVNLWAFADFKTFGFEMIGKVAV